ncbi:hypothetical protein CDAR_432461 [Caerostris darwini]|uniref:Uncharacterized protein n=1 Tax=Caerostris darwini TaxID=1538125 RepID=A0AAV4U2Z3_9ARAC|nr:hypothetical protein CDAR_432461 [Caerostris darwini]
MWQEVERHAPETLVLSMRPVFPSDSASMGKKRHFWGGEEALMMSDIPRKESDQMNLKLEHNRVSPTVTAVDPWLLFDVQWVYSIRNGAHRCQAQRLKRNILCWLGPRPS